MSERCYTYKGVHIPGCWGCAIYGHSRCNCPPRSKQDEMQRLTRRVERLEKMLISASDTERGETT